VASSLLIDLVVDPTQPKPVRALYGKKVKTAMRGRREKERHRISRPGPNLMRDRHVSPPLASLPPCRHGGHRSSLDPNSNAVKPSCKYYR
jgi:hypothetical protein